jgi:hypothetical protein
MANPDMNQNEQKNSEPEEKKEKKPGFFARRIIRLKSSTQKVVGVGAIKDGANSIRASLRILDPRRLSKKEVKVESFDESFARHNQTEEGLQRIYKMFLWRFYIAFVFFVLTQVYMLASAALGQIWLAVVILAVSAVPGALCLTAAFRLHQLYVREWCSWSQWFENKDGWWPNSVSRLRKKHKKIAYLKERAMRV